MPGIPFHETRMGHHLVTQIAPRATREIGRLADAVERLNGLLEQLLASRGIEPTAPAAHSGPGATE